MAIFTSIKVILTKKTGGFTGLVMCFCVDTVNNSESNLDISYVYITRNINKRKEATLASQKNLYKLLNNSIFVE